MSKPRFAAVMLGKGGLLHISDSHQNFMYSTKLTKGFTQAYILNALSRLRGCEHIVFVGNGPDSPVLPQVDNGRRITTLNFGVMERQLDSKISRVNDADALAASIRRQTEPRTMPVTGVVMIDNDPSGDGGYARWYGLDDERLVHLTVDYTANEAPGPLLLRTGRPLSHATMMVATLADRLAERYSSVEALYIWSSSPFPASELEESPDGTTSFLGRYLTPGHIRPVVSSAPQMLLAGGVALAAGLHFLPQLATV